LKRRNILLGQMMTLGSDVDSIGLLQVIGELVYLFAKEIRSRLKKNANALNEFIADHTQDHGKQLFSVSPPTLTNIIGDFPEKDANRVLTSQVATISERLAKQGLKPSSQLLAIDPSDILYRGKFQNQWTPYSYIGQKNQYKHAHKEIILHSDPIQLVTGCAISPIKGKKHAEQPLVLWIQQIQEQIQRAHLNKSPFAIILGDREFYSGIGNAFSFLGLWDLTLPAQMNPRLVTPKKIWKNSPEKKWQYLLDSSKKIVEYDEIELDYYDQPFLEGFLHHLPSNPKGTRYMVPVASVAVFDTYSNNHAPKTMDWAHSEAQLIESHLHQLNAELKTAEHDYMIFLRKNKRIKIVPPSYRKRRRKIFKDSNEKALYHDCCRVYDLQCHWKKRQENLLKRLMFFCVSLHKNEVISGNDAEFIACCQLYHQRWGIEINVKTMKWEYPIKTNCRKPTRRHFNWIVSAMVENSWHFYRLTRAARILKKSDPFWKPFHRENPVKRIKWERSFRPILSAHGYLREIFLQGLKDTLKGGWKN